MENIKRAAAPILLALIGLTVVIYGFANTQPPLFMLGAFAFLVAGIISILSAMDMFNKTIRTGIFAVLVVFSLVLTWLDFKAIKDPMDFEKEKTRRYTYVIQNLKDLREAQMAYKTRFGKFAGGIDSLVDFIKNDSVLVIVSDGTVPDGFTKEQAIDSGYVTIDTNKVAAGYSIFNESYLLGRKVPFNMDSLGYVPFTGVPFDCEAGIIERSKVKVPVFLISDAAPFDKTDVMMVGSMTDPTTSGNWGE